MSTPSLTRPTLNMLRTYNGGMVKALQPEVIHEEDDFLVINKPAGMTVNRSETTKGETVQDWAERKFKVPRRASPRGKQSSKFKVDSTDFLRRSGVVHRLDKDTSGVLVIAKTPETFAEVQRQFKEREVEKEYVALVHGRVVPLEGTVRLPIGRSQKDRHRFEVNARGKEAETRWVVEGYYKRGEDIMTLVRLLPKTGRTHQLRVHLTHLGHPLVGDKRYLSKKRGNRDSSFCPRQFLHAGELCFRHMGKTKCFVAPLAADLQRVLGSLTKTT